MNPESERLRRIFDAPGWKRLIDKIRRLRDADRPIPREVVLADPTDEERRSLAALLRMDKPSRAGKLRYPLDDVSRALARAGVASEWPEIIGLLCGPAPASLVVERECRIAWRNFWSSAVGIVEDQPFAGQADWVESMRRDGSLRKLAAGDVVQAECLLKVSAGLLATLPLSEEVPLAQAAARFCGDSHGLDPGRPIATLVLRGLAARGAQPFPGRTAERRALWAEFGIVCDELSAPVLVLNLGVTGSAPLADLVFSATRAGQPIHLSTRLLWSTPWEDLAFPSRVFVCENPTVVALAASRFGPRCPPLVCVDGEPKTAARILLRTLRARGADLHYHGDFDWPGLAIAERVFRQFGAVPWLFDADAYGKARAHTGRSLQGRPVPTPWSPRLSEEMRIRGTAYDEELLADLLLDDLARVL